jgi:protein CpxP
MKKIKLLLIVTALMVAGSAILYAHGGRGYGKRGGGFGNCGGAGMGMFRHEDALRNLGVSEAVREKIRKIHFDARQERFNIRNKMQEKRFELREAYLKKDLDKKAVLRLTKEIAELRNEMQIKNTEKRLEILALLTPEQREKLREGFGRGYGRRHREGGPRDGRGQGRGRRF